MFQDFISKIIELLIIPKSLLEERILIILLMKLHETITRNSQEMSIIEKRLEMMHSEINKMILQEMRILDSKSS
jgi:hypothetical protein